MTFFPVSRQPMPGAAGLLNGEAVIIRFNFTREDIVFVGQGVLADAAMPSIIESGATTVILQTADSWQLGRGRQPVPREEQLLFDTGRIPQSRDLLRSLAATPESDRVFLVGEVPEGVTFPYYHHLPHHIEDGAPTGWLQRHALCNMCLEFGFTPVSLHDVVEEPPRWWSEQAAANGDAPSLEASLHSIRSELKKRHRDSWDNQERPGKSYLIRATPSGLMQELLLVRTLRRWTECPFDTAYLDTQIVDWFADRGTRVLLVETNVILLGGDALFEHAAARRLLLYAFSAGLEEERGRRGE